MLKRRLNFILSALLLTAVLTSLTATTDAKGLGQIPPGSIQGTVFFDLNLNGSLDPGEGSEPGTGVEGARVRLLDATGTVLKEYIVSDAEGGTFKFVGLPLGTYTVVEVDPAVMASTTPNEVSVTLTAEAPQATGVNFGDVALRTVSGRIYEDRDANGAYNPGDTPLSNATVSVIDDLNGNGHVDAGEGILGSAVTDSYGLYAVHNILPGARILQVQNEVGGVIAEPLPITIPADPAGGVEVEDVPLYTISGRVYEDRDASGSFNYGDVPLADVTVLAIADKDAGGQVDTDEGVVGSAISDQYGLYVIRYVNPGPYLMILQNAVGGAIGDPIPVFVPPDPTGGVGPAYDLGVRFAVLSGVVWHDVDGDELISEGEPGLSGVRLNLLGAVCGVPGGQNVLATVETDQSGSYRFTGLAPGNCYELQPDAATLPSGWVLSRDPAELSLNLASAGAYTLDLGYYDPLAVDPLRQAEWKRELRQLGKPRYTTDQLNSFIATAENASAVFAEVVGIRDMLLKHPIYGAKGSAMKEHAALWLNLASKRLFETTPVSLPELTTATTVGAVRDEIESVLLQSPQTTAEYDRVRRLAQLINSGKGLGYNKQGTMQVSKATYRGNSVASRLRQGGEYVDMYDSPLYLQSWSPGSLSSSTNVFRPQLRVKALAFYNNAILEVQQTMPNGQTVILGTATPTTWNNNVNAAYTFDLRGVTTVGELASARLQLYTRVLPPAASTLQVLVQNTAGEAKMDIKPGQRGSQSFLYGQSDDDGDARSFYIHKLVLRLSRESQAPDSSLRVSIGTGINTGALEGSQVSIAPSQVTDASGGSTFMTYEVVYANPVGPLTQGRRYYLNFENQSPNGKAYYITYAGNSTYSGGTYYKELDDDEKDAWFQLWGTTDGGTTGSSSSSSAHIKIDSTELVFDY